MNKYRINKLRTLGNALAESRVYQTIKEPKIYSELKKIFDKNFSISFKYTPPFKKESRTFSISKEGKTIKGSVIILNHNESKKKIKMGFKFDIDIFLDKGNLVVSKSNIVVENCDVSFLFGGFIYNIPTLVLVRKYGLLERLRKRRKYIYYKLYIHDDTDEVIYMTETHSEKVDRRILDEIDESLSVKKFYRYVDTLPVADVADTLTSMNEYADMFSFIYSLCALQLVVENG